MAGGGSMSEAMLVKEEPAEEEAGSRGASEAAARAGLCADRAVKDELGLGPEAPQPPDAVFRINMCVKVEAEFVKEETETKEEAGDVKEETEKKEEAVDVKEEPEWISVSAEAARAGLYAGHVVKGELVLGPEGPQPQDSVFVLCGSRARARAPACGQQPGPPSAAAAPGHEAAPRPAPPSECPTCHKQFSYPSRLKTHLRTHTEEKPFSCDVCKRQFRQLSHLKTHERIHSGERRYSCDICKKQFTRASNLKQHERIHTGEKRYSCDICKKQFTFLSNLNAHGRIHTAKKHYICDFCKKWCNTKSNLCNHIQIHMRRKPSLGTTDRGAASTRRELRE